MKEAICGSFDEAEGAQESTKGKVNEVGDVDFRRTQRFLVEGVVVNEADTLISSLVVILVVDGP